LGRQVHGDPFVAGFVGVPKEEVAQYFFRKKSFPTEVRSFPALYRAYDLYLGAFLAADYLDEGGLVAPVLSIAASGKGKKRRLAELRRFDPERLHRRSQSLRGALLAKARDMIDDAENINTGLVIMGKLGACLQDSPIPLMPQSVCTEETVLLAPYYGSCASSGELVSLATELAACGRTVSSRWGVIIEAYCRRFPGQSDVLREELSQYLEEPEIELSLRACP